MQSTESPEAIAAEASRRAKDRNILRKTALDMVRSLALIGVVVLAIFFLVPRPETKMIPSADVSAMAAAAETAGDVPVVVPSVPTGWQATSARREAPHDGLPATWHIGYLTSSGEYAGLEMTNKASDDWFEDVTTDGTDIQTPLDVNGVEWATRVSAENRVSYVWGEEGSPATVVTGTASRDELLQLAEAVQAAG